MGQQFELNELAAQQQQQPKQSKANGISDSRGSGKRSSSTIGRKGEAVAHQVASMPAATVRAAPAGSSAVDILHDQTPAATNTKQASHVKQIPGNQEGRAQAAFEHGTAQAAAAAAAAECNQPMPSPPGTAANAAGAGATPHNTTAVGAVGAAAAAAQKESGGRNRMSVSQAAASKHARKQGSMEAFLKTSTFLPKADSNHADGAGTEGGGQGVQRGQVPSNAADDVIIVSSTDTADEGELQLGAQVGNSSVQAVAAADGNMEAATAAVQQQVASTTPHTTAAAADVQVVSSSGQDVENTAYQDGISDGNDIDDDNDDHTATSPSRRSSKRARRTKQPDDERVPWVTKQATAGGGSSRKKRATGARQAATAAAVACTDGSGNDAVAGGRQAHDAAAGTGNADGSMSDATTQSAPAADGDGADRQGVATASSHPLQPQPGPRPPKGHFEAISVTGHTNRGRVRQKSHKTVECLEVGLCDSSKIDNLQLACHADMQITSSLWHAA